ncbi:hypothetical protein [Aurantiacibacter sp. MUD61]|uniref:hypothetical protein n=1 Tax=Aurantiacibacter sp. MUD61 TaxID=3009083 RepID=UPI0022EFF6DD|nr:hypothetical protein [Aurantiacibacter sp. MUD61]
MKRFLALMVSAALLVPTLTAYGSAVVEAQDAAPSRPGQRSIPVLGFDPAGEHPFDQLEHSSDDRIQHQVRVQQRVVIRIGPAAPRDRRTMLNELPRRPMTARFEEVDHGNCIDAEDIIGIQPTNDNRLLFFLDNSNVLAAQLQNGCSARAFYAGFYIERSDDGRLCVARDRLQSRAGGSCQIADFTRLVAVAN